MQFVRSDHGLAIGDKFRIETGPARITAKATCELLGCATADHYAAPRPASEQEIANPKTNTPEGLIYSIDALGQPIQIGQEITYLDWVGFQRAESPVRAFYLYELHERTPEEAELHPDTTIWRERGIYDTEEAAISAALGA